VVIHHAPGQDEWTLEICWKLAHRGYAAISPHLYGRHGSDPEEAPNRARARGGMRDDQVMGDIDGSAKYLRGRPFSNGTIGIIGDCSGGRQSFLAACTVPGIDAAIDCWGGGVIVDSPDQLNEQRPVAPITYAENLNCPLLGLFGAEDQSPSPQEVDRTEEELKRLNKTYEFYRYEGASHAFFATDRYRYRPEQAVDAWKRITAFYDRYLKVSGAGATPRFIGASPLVSLSGNVPLRA
jgi:carboxymethylenebutenolidase